MRIYNTLTRKIEEFVPWNGNKVGFYTCGPTVYHYAHIGNMRNYIGHDILDKTLRYLGYDVKRVMNITDVGHLTSDSDSGDDKMVASAKKENKTVMDIARFYTDAFFHDFELVNNRMPEVVSPATANINVYIKPEYDNKIYTVEDFSPLEIYILKHSQDNSRYLITLAHYDMKHLVDAVIKLLSFEFVESVELVNMPQGI